MCVIPPYAANKGQRGFTLFELIMVLAVMALFAVFVVSRPKVDTIAGRNAIFDVAGAFRTARADALKTGQIAIVELDMEAGVLTASDGRQLSISDKIDLSADGAASDRAEVILYFFLPSGMASGGQVVIDDQAVLIDWLTGRVSIVSGVAP